MRTEEWMKCAPWTARGMPCPWQDRRLEEEDDDDDDPEEDPKLAIPAKRKVKHTRVQMKMTADVANAIKEAEYQLGLTYAGAPVVDALIKTAIIVAAAAVLAKGIQLTPGLARGLNAAASTFARWSAGPTVGRGKGAGFVMHENWTVYIKQITAMGGARKMGVARLSPQALYASGMGGPLAVER